MQSLLEEPETPPEQVIARSIQSGNIKSGQCFVFVNGSWTLSHIHVGKLLLRSLQRPFAQAEIHFPSFGRFPWRDESGMTLHLRRAH